VIASLARFKEILLQVVMVDGMLKGNGVGSINKVKLRRAGLLLE